MGLSKSLPNSTGKTLDPSERAMNISPLFPKSSVYAIWDPSGDQVQL